jgi:hypothetical protein
MTAAFEELIHLLDEREIGYATGDDLSVRTDLRGVVATYRIVARVEAEADLFQVFGYSPLRVPAGCRPAVAEAVARANYGLRVGKFELDCDDGDVRFQVSQILTGDAVGEEVIDRMIGTVSLYYKPPSRLGCGSSRRSRTGRSITWTDLPANR